MEETLIAIKNEASTLILGTETFEDLERIKLEYLGKSGKLTTALKELPKVPAERRPEVGKLANEIKKTIELLVSEKEKALKTVKKETSHSHLDVTLPGKKAPLGHLHLVTQAIEEITDIFSRIGFDRVRHPEVEWDWYAFGALNFPENHPARDDWETFFVDEPYSDQFGPMLLTPHTSNGQIREMERVLAEQVEEQQNENDIEIRMLNITKTYRRQSDISHSAMFHQFETLCVGKNISITHLKGVLDYFVKSWFGPDRKSRIRPYHFQFTEPSFETDVSCDLCKGTGKLENGENCRLCKEGWLEMGGAGMVHPNVLKNCGLDPKIYTGFASGWGVERVLMVREGISLPDLRMIYSNDLDFLEQF